MRAFVLSVLAVSGFAAGPEFNRDIRPILSDRCFSCHGPDSANRKANLRLDIEAEAKRSSIITGNAAQSPLFQRVSTTNKARRMPPAYAGHDALAERDVELLRAWIDNGATYQSHWSFIPPKRPAGTIDSLIRAKLAKEGLKPSPPADKRTLIRRVTLDLTGLPPTPEEVDAILKDGSYEKVVDRLLATSRYAERMAIRWLEAARYSDTNGYQTDGPRTMWPWRDWVINAFHKDMPFDQFTVEQIAGDLLPKATLSQKIATGFHRNHRTSAEGGIVDEEFRVEYVADRAETTGTVWMGLTVGCARCHDHKFDPIKQKDFYSLFAFFNTTPERGFVWNFGNEEPVIQAPSPEQAAKLDSLNKAVQRYEANLPKPKPTAACEITRGQKLHIPGPHEFHDAGTSGPVFDYRDPFTIAARVKPETATGAIVSRGDDYVEGQQHGVYIMDGKLRLHVTFRWTDLAMRVETVKPLPLGQWSHIAVSYDGNMRARGVRMYVNGEPQELKVLFDYLLWPMDTKKHPWRIGAGGGLRFKGSVEDVRVYDRVVEPEAVLALAGNAEARSRVCFYESNPIFAQLLVAKQERDKFSATIPTVMVMKEAEQPRQAYILKRGAYDAPGEPVSPAIPAFLGSLPPGAPKNRLGLAKWLVDESNPITARVAVNRFWAMLFGTGLVKTVEDFGSQGEWPLHQEVLDLLAVDFMNSGWSVKKTLKAIVMSDTYRQASRVTPELHQRDPENRLLARGPRIRLSAEMIRDQALAASGLLVDKVGGPPVKPYQPAGLWQELQGGKGYVEDKGEGLYRRSLYTYWRRTVAPPDMVAFDSPTRETCVVRESRTNTPLQALTLMNDRIYVEASHKLAERMRQAADPIGRGFELVLARPPRDSERATLQTALTKLGGDYSAVASILLNMDEAVTKE